MATAPAYLLCFLWSACTPAETPPPPAPSVPMLPSCEVVEEGVFAASPATWAAGSTPLAAVWHDGTTWVGEQLRVDGDPAGAWVVEDELWVAVGNGLARHSLDGREVVPLDLSALTELPDDARVIDVSRAPDAPRRVWVTLARGGEEPGGILLRLGQVEGAEGWTVAARLPEKGVDSAAYGDVHASASRAAVVRRGERPEVLVVSTGGRVLRRVRLPAVGEGTGPAGLGLIGQGVLAVLADGQVVLDRPGHRHRERLGGLQQLQLGPRGLIALDADGTARARVADGLGLRDGAMFAGPAWGVFTVGSEAVVIAPEDSGEGLEVTRGPLAPEATGPTWSPRYPEPHRCRLGDGARPLLPPLLGVDGTVRLALPGPEVGEEMPPEPARWVVLAPR